MKGDGFYYHKPGAAAQKTLGDNRRRYRDLRDWLKSLPQTRETSLSITKLQESMMFANAAIVLTDPEAEALE